MEVSVGGLIFLVFLAVTILSERNKQDDKIAKLKRDIIEKENKIKCLQNQQQNATPEKTIHIVEKITECEKIVYVPVPVKQQQPQKVFKALQTAKIFVQVIFKKNSKRRYDYYLGDNYNVRVGDFVKVYAYDKWAGKSRLRIAKVLYISAPGETSAYANTIIEGKTVQPQWWR